MNMTRSYRTERNKVSKENAEKEKSRSKTVSLKTATPFSQQDKTSKKDKKKFQTWEAKRRKRFNDVIEELRQTLYCDPCPKIEVIQAAVKFIKDHRRRQNISKDNLDHNDDSTNRDRAVVEKLRKQNILLTLILKEAGIRMESDKVKGEVIYYIPVSCHNAKLRKVLINLSSLQLEKEFATLHEKKVVDKQVQTEIVLDDLNSSVPLETQESLKLSSKYDKLSVTDDVSAGTLQSVSYVSSSEGKEYENLPCHISSVPCAVSTFDHVDSLINPSADPSTTVSSNAFKKGYSEHIIVEGEEKHGSVTVKLISALDEEGVDMQHQDPVGTSSRSVIGNSNPVLICNTSVNEPYVIIHNVGTQSPTACNVLNSEKIAKKKMIILKGVSTDRMNSNAGYVFLPHVNENQSYAASSLSHTPIMSTGLSATLPKASFIHAQSAFPLLLPQPPVIPTVTTTTTVATNRLKRIAPKPVDPPVSDDGLATTNTKYFLSPKKRSRSSHLSTTSSKGKRVRRSPEDDYEKLKTAAVSATEKSGTLVDYPSGNPSVEENQILCIKEINASTLSSHVHDSHIGENDDDLEAIIDLHDDMPCVIPETMQNSELESNVVTEERLVEMLCSMEAEDRGCTFSPSPPSQSISFKNISSQDGKEKESEETHDKDSGDGCSGPTVKSPEPSNSSVINNVKQRPSDNVSGASSSEPEISTTSSNYSIMSLCMPSKTAEKNVSRTGSAQNTYYVSSHSTVENLQAPSESFVSSLSDSSTAAVCKPASDSIVDGHLMKHSTAEQKHNSSVSQLSVSSLISHTVPTSESMISKGLDLQPLPDLHVPPISKSCTSSISMIRPSLYLHPPPFPTPPLPPLGLPTLPLPTLPVTHHSPSIHNFSFTRHTVSSAPVVPTTSNHSFFLSHPTCTSTITQAHSASSTSAGEIKPLIKDASKLAPITGSACFDKSDNKGNTTKINTDRPISAKTSVAVMTPVSTQSHKMFSGSVVPTLPLFSTVTSSSTPSIAKSIFSLAPITSYAHPFPFCALSLSDAPTTFSFTLTKNPSITSSCSSHSITATTTTNSDKKPKCSIACAVSTSATSVVHAQLDSSDSTSAHSVKSDPLIVSESEVSKNSDLPVFTSSTSVSPLVASAQSSLTLHPTANLFKHSLQLPKSKMPITSSVKNFNPLLCSSIYTAPEAHVSLSYSTVDSPSCSFQLQSSNTASTTTTTTSASSGSLVCDQTHSELKEMPNNQSKNTLASQLAKIITNTLGRNHSSPDPQAKTICTSHASGIAATQQMLSNRDEKRCLDADAFKLPLLPLSSYQVDDPSSVTTVPDSLSLACNKSKNVPVASEAKFSLSDKSVEDASDSTCNVSSNGSVPHIVSYSDTLKSSDGNIVSQLAPLEVSIVTSESAANTESISQDTGSFNSSALFSKPLCSITHMLSHVEKLTDQTESPAHNFQEPKARHIISSKLNAARDHASSDSQTTNVQEKPLNCTSLTVYPVAKCSASVSLDQGKRLLEPDPTVPLATSLHSLLGEFTSTKEKNSLFFYEDKTQKNSESKFTGNRLSLLPQERNCSFASSEASSLHDSSTETTALSSSECSFSENRSSLKTNLSLDVTQGGNCSLLETEISSKSTTDAVLEISAGTERTFQGGTSALGSQFESQLVTANRSATSMIKPILSIRSACDKLSSVNTLLDNEHIFSHSISSSVDSVCTSVVSKGNIPESSSTCNVSSNNILNVSAPAVQVSSAVEKTDTSAGIVLQSSCSVTAENSDDTTAIVLNSQNGMQHGIAASSLVNTTKENTEISVNQKLSQNNFQHKLHSVSTVSNENPHRNGNMISTQEPSNKKPTSEVTVRSSDSYNFKGLQAIKSTSCSLSSVQSFCSVQAVSGSSQPQDSEARGPQVTRSENVAKNFVAELENPNPSTSQQTQQQQFRSNCQVNKTQHQLVNQVSMANHNNGGQALAQPSGNAFLSSQIQQIQLHQESQKQQRLPSQQQQQQKQITLQQQTQQHHPSNQQQQIQQQQQYSVTQTNSQKQQQNNSSAAVLPNNQSHSIATQPPSSNGNSQQLIAQQQQLLVQQQQSHHPQMHQSHSHLQTLNIFDTPAVDVASDSNSVKNHLSGQQQHHHSPMGANSGYVQSFDYNPYYRKPSQSPRSDSRHQCYAYKHIQHFQQDMLGDSSASASHSVIQPPFLEGNEDVGIRGDDESDHSRGFSVSHLVSPFSEHRKASVIGQKDQQSSVTLEEKNKEVSKKTSSRKSESKSQGGSKGNSSAGNLRRRSPARSTPGQHSSNSLAMWNNNKQSSPKQGQTYSAEALISSQNYPRPPNRQSVNQNYHFIPPNQMYQSTYSSQQMKNFVQNPSFGYSGHDRSGVCNSDYNFQLHPQTSGSLPYGPNVPYMASSYPYQNLPSASSSVLPGDLMTSSHHPGAYSRLHDINSEHANFAHNAAFPLSMDPQDMCGGTALTGSASTVGVRTSIDPPFSIASSPTYPRFATTKNTNASLSSGSGHGISSSGKRSRYVDTTMMGSGMGTPTNFLEGSALSHISLHSFTPPCEDTSIMHSNFLTGSSRHQSNFLLGSDNFMPLNSSQYSGYTPNVSGSIGTSSNNSVSSNGSSHPLAMGPPSASRCGPPTMPHMLPHGTSGHVPFNPLRMMDRQQMTTAPSIGPHMSSSLSNFNLTTIFPEIDGKNDESTSAMSSSTSRQGPVTNSEGSVNPGYPRHSSATVPSLATSEVQKSGSGATSQSNTVNNSMNSGFPPSHQVGLGLNSSLSLTPSAFPGITFTPSEH